MKSLILMFLLILIGCGIETGNPHVSSGNPNDNQESLNSEVSLITSRACKKISECYSVTESSCINGIPSQNNFDLPLGISDNIYSNLTEIINAETSGAITPDYSSADQCKVDIDNSLCSDQRVIDAFSNSAPTNFSNVYKILPSSSGSCIDVF